MTKTNKYVVSFDDYYGDDYLWVKDMRQPQRGIAHCFLTRGAALRQYKAAMKGGLKPVLSILTPVKVK